ncbi:MAG: S8 family serine peptidase [Caulobacter sp.]|nr:S8 family serine peptidase [Caulobacter sp.]
MTPSATSAEYTRSWSLAAINAVDAFDTPATGAGITVAVIDTGINFSQPDLAGRISPLSTDVFPGRNQPDRGSDHGTRVATVIAANFDGVGTLGVAYQATILSIRADDSPGACPTDGCQFSDRELVTAIDYAIAHGARVINLSIGGDTPDSAAFEAALQRAVAAGLVVTASAGNDSTASPDWPARYAVDPRYLGALMAVGASAEDGSMASFSGRAGAAANGYIVAPGEDIVTDCDGTGCWRVSGTSFSSPIVAGSLALLLQAFPMISGRDAVEILFRTATDRGDPGVDPIWGHGFLDLRAAFRPVGALNVPTASGSVFVPSAPPGTRMGPAFGDALRQGDALTTFGRDDYRRIYKVNLADAFPSGSGGLLGAAMPVVQAASVAVSGPARSRFSIQAERPVFADAMMPDRMLDLTGLRQPSSTMVSADIGYFSLTAWRGEGGARAPDAGRRDVFRALAAPDQVMQAAWRFNGGLVVSAEQGRSERLDVLALREVEASRYLSTTVSFERGLVAASLTAGAVDEPLGPLGSDIASTSVFSLPAETRFGAVSLTSRTSEGLTMRADAAFGRTRVSQGILDTPGVLSSQWRMGAYGDCHLIGLACGNFAIELEQPLRIEGGLFTTVLADVPADWRDPTTFSTRRFSASPSGRELDLRLTIDRDFGAWGLLRLRTVAAFQDGNREDVGLSLGGAVDWRLTF